MISLQMELKGLLKESARALPIMPSTSTDRNCLPATQDVSHFSPLLMHSMRRQLDTPRVATGRFAYARLRKDDYTDEELTAWHAWMAEQAVTGRDVFVYLKHDEDGTSPEYALRLLADA